ncbi:recombinase family protein [uncultured Psychroserpens sp.]|uniref:recombinase family protein n=1 Tax=uncultured Psychroserpens sp. TaxID=255436 RepID=UPI00260A12CD|nr:recombinase family protein [uncultured Psychroserpens sp.]
MEKDTLKYFIYARKSSESEDRQMASIEDQKKEVEKIAEELDLNIVGVFSESKSAKAPGRKSFNEMLLRIEKGEADGIICWKLNRLARNPVDGGKISWMLQNNIIKHIQCFGRDYWPSDNVLMMQVELGMANQFVKDLSVDVRRGMRQKAERGWNPFPTLPIGYLHNKDRKGKVMPEEITTDPERFPIVLKLWKLMLTGSYSISDIKKKGDKLGLVNHKKSPYCVHTYHKLFKTEFYYGYFQARDAKGNLKRYKGRHKPMVNERDFNKVQVFIGNYKRGTRSKSYNYTFKGLMNCGECGCSITAERKFQVRCTGCRNKFSCLHRNDCPKCDLSISEMKSPNFIDITYYRCTKRRQPCSQKTITEKELTRQYAKALKSVQIPKDFYDFIIKELKEISEKENHEEKILIGQTKKKVGELEKRLNGLALLKADGDISKEQYNEIKKETISELQNLKFEIISLEQNFSDWMTIAKEYLNFALNTSKVLTERDVFTKRQLLLKLGSNQLLMNRKLLFSKAKPLLSIEKCHQLYEAEKGTFEPKNPLEKQGDLGSFDTCNVSVCPRVHDVRTSIQDFMKCLTRVGINN